MHVLYAAEARQLQLERLWLQVGVTSTFLGPAEMLEMLTRKEWRAAVLADAIVLTVGDLGHTFENPTVLQFAEELRKLPDDAAMSDGRKWNALPLVLATKFRYMPTDLGMAAPIVAKSIRDVKLLDLEDSPGEINDVIVRVIRDYRERVLNELDRLGFIVTYESGRYRVGPALKPRTTLTGRYYFGGADQRSGGVVTVDRDVYGMQIEVETFEALINRANVTERELQEFFTECPHFLSLVSQALPQVPLRDNAGNVLIPDFILRPIVAVSRDSRWEVVDLKLPNAKLLSGVASRRRLSHEVIKAIRQLRDYGDYFADPRNAAEIQSKVGHSVRKPRLGVVIGRLKGADSEALELEQSRVTDVRIVTYDEILEQQQALVERRGLTTR